MVLRRRACALERYAVTSGDRNTEPVFVPGAGFPVASIAARRIPVTGGARCERPGCRTGGNRAPARADSGWVSRCATAARGL